MNARNLCAYDRDGRLLVAARGTELAVFSAADTKSRWRGSAAAEIVGLGVTEAEVVTLDASGGLVWWNAESGAKNDSLSVEGSARAMAVDLDGVVAVAFADSVKLIDPGDSPRTLSAADTEFVAWAPDGTRVALASQSTVRVFDEAKLKELGSVTLEHAVQALADAGVAGYFCITTAGLHRVDAEGQTAELVVKAPFLPEFGEVAAGHLVAAGDGSVLALADGAGQLVVLRGKDGKLVVRVRAGKETVRGFALTGRALSVLLASGGSVRVDLRTGAKAAVDAANLSSVESLEVEVLGELEAPRKKTRRKTAKPALPKTEEEANSPDRHTLGLLGVVAFASLVLWGSARFACNYHPPQSLKPREVGTVELARTAKGAAVEAFQRIGLMELDSALEIVSGAGQREIEKLKQQCEKDVAACESRKQNLAGKVFTTAELLRQDTRSAAARVTSHVQGEPPKTYDVDLVQDGPIWKVTRYSPAK
jgi:hypothetical protein